MNTTVADHAKAIEESIRSLGENIMFDGRWVKAILPSPPGGTAALDPDGFRETFDEIEATIPKANLGEPTVGKSQVIVRGRTYRLASWRDEGMTTEKLGAVTLNLERV